MSNTNEIELNRLNKLIADLQWNIFQGGGFQAATTSILVQSLGDAERRLARAERAEIITREEEGRKQQLDLAVAIVMAERETKLSQTERREFGSFLNCEFFRRSDFGRLEHFYTNTWDRLTEEGKAEMSHRVWGGVKRGEYQFIELPDPVKEKEAERLHQMLERSAPLNSKLREIPEIDRHDFLKAREDGQSQESYKVLNRPSFAAALGSYKSHEIAAVAAVKNENDKGSISSAGAAGAGVSTAAPEKPKIIDNGNFGLDDLGTFAVPLKHSQANVAVNPPSKTETPHR